MIKANDNALASVDFKELAVHQVGTGPALLLVHGVGMCAESWGDLVSQLSERFTVTTVDLPGHGDSAPLSCSFDESQVANFVEALAPLCQQLNSPLYLCGHSLGALICIELAARFADKVNGLLALNAVFQRTAQARDAVMQRAQTLQQNENIVGVNQTLERWFKDQSSRERNNCERWLRANSKDGYALAYRAFANTSGAATSTLEAIQCRSIFATGALDRNSTAQMSESMAQLVKAQSKSFNLAGAGHMMPLTNPTEVASLLDELAITQNTP